MPGMRWVITSRPQSRCLLKISILCSWLTINQSCLLGVIIALKIIWKYKMNKKSLKQIFYYVSSAIGSCILVACSSGSGSSTTAASSVDYNGTYAATGVACYSAQGGTSVASAPFSQGAETIVISGNSYTSTSTSSGCVVNGAATVTFDPSAKTVLIF